MSFVERNMGKVILEHRDFKLLKLTFQKQLIKVIRELDENSADDWSIISDMSFELSVEEINKLSLQKVLWLINQYPQEFKGVVSSDLDDIIVSVRAVLNALVSTSILYSIKDDKDTPYRVREMVKSYFETEKEFKRKSISWNRS